jgi:MacB-like periplasmic core domain
MIRLRVFIRRLRGLFFRQRLERDLEEEIRSHLEMQIEENVGQGMSPDAARQAALRKFGGVAHVKEVYRDRLSLPAIETAFQDLRYGLRMLRKSPGWTAVMCATLALGIGLSTAIFSLAYGILLRSLPYPDPDRLVALHNNSSNPAAAGIPRLGACSADWEDWRAQSRLFEEIALTRMVTSFNLTGDGRPERVVGTRTTWNLPQVLGLQPLLGRYFTEEEARRDASVAVLSYRFYDVRSMEARLDRSLQSRNLLTGLVTLFGGASLLLACLGLYGVVSYSAGLRLREFAIRTALGAQPGDIRRLVLAHATRLWISGTAIGLVAAWPAGRALQNQLYGVGSADAVALALAPSLLLVIALLAGLGPARRAGRVGPAVTLRAD